MIFVAATNDKFLDVSLYLVVEKGKLSCAPIVMENALIFPLFSTLLTACMNDSWLSPQNIAQNRVST